MVYNYDYTVNWFKTGIANTLGYELRSSDGTVRQVRSTGFVEDPQDSGTYTITLQLDRQRGNPLTIIVDDVKVFFNDTLIQTPQEDVPPEEESELLLSPYPLTGLVHSLAITKDALDDIEDTAGGVAESSTVVVYESISCRVTTHSGDMRDLPAGKNGANVFTVIAEYSPDIQSGMYAIIQSGSAASRVSNPGTYDITWVKQQTDELGRMHHTSFMMELR